MSVITTDESTFDFPRIVADLNRLLRLRATPIGMKMFKTKEEMEQIPRIRRPSDVHTTDQIVGQACRNGWTVGITMDDLVGAQCGTVIGLHPRTTNGFPVTGCTAFGLALKRMLRLIRPRWMF